MIINELFKEDICNNTNLEIKFYSIVTVKTLNQNNISIVSTIILFKKPINISVLWEYIKEFCEQRDLYFHSFIIYQDPNEFKISKQFLKLIRLYNPPIFADWKVSHKIDSYNKPKMIKTYHLNTVIESNFEKSNFIDLENFSLLPKSQGIYFIYNSKNKLMYIGKSINIRSRIYSHIHDEYSDWKHNFSKVKFIRLPNLNDKELDDYETYFINEEKPPLNLSKVYTYNSERYSLKYNKEIIKFENLRHYAKYLVGKDLVNNYFCLDKLLEERQQELDDLKEMLL